MLAILEEPAVRERVSAFTVANYHRLLQFGALAPNVELIRGALVDQTPKAPLHTSIVTLLFRHLLAQVPEGWHARSEQPLSFASSDSEPEPDLAVVRGTEQDFFQDHPTTAALVIEVIVSSERLNRIKLGIYAEAGVPESWLIFAEERTVERHTEPHGAAYARVDLAVFPATLESTIFPRLCLPFPALFPKR